MSPEEARALFSDQTRVSYDHAHGTQVTYTAPDGGTHLWYPGNAVILHGTWEIRPAGVGIARPAVSIPADLQTICFQYPNSYNPYAPGRGDRPECAAVHVMTQRGVDRVQGDVFGLSSRNTPPFTLGRERTTLAELQARLPPQPRGTNRVGRR